MPLNRMMPGPQSTITRKMRTYANMDALGDRAVIDTYFYTTPLRSLAASGTDIFSIPVQEDAEFVAEWITGILAQDVATVIEWRLGSGATQNAENGITNVAGTIRITDTGSNRQMMDRPVYWHSVVGTAQNPLYLAAPKHFRPNASIQIEVTNLVATAAFWQVTLGGIKIYKVGRV